MNITDNSLDFTGMFWVVGSSGNRFLGEIKYRFGEPIKLTFTIVDELILSGTIDLHGVLSNGKRCSLIGVGFRKLNRPIDGRFTVYCQYVLIGNHQTAGTEYTKWVFRFSGMMEFFYPSYMEFQGKIPLDEKKIDFKINAFNYHTEIDYNFNLTDIDARARIKSTNRDALQKLNEYILKIKEDYSHPILSIATDKSLVAVVDCMAGKTISDIFDSLQSLNNLFSIFFRKPVCLEFVNIYRRGGDRNASKYICCDSND